MYLYMAPIFFGVPYAMYWIVDHKPQDEMETDLREKYKHLTRSNDRKKTLREGFKNVVLEKGKQDTLDEILHRGSSRKTKIEFNGPRARGTKEDDAERL